MMRRLRAAWRVLLGRPIITKTIYLDGKEIARAIHRRGGGGDAKK